MKIEEILFILGFIPWFIEKYVGYIILLMILGFIIYSAITHNKIKKLQQDMKILDDMTQNRWSYRRDQKGPKYAPGGKEDRL